MFEQVLAENTARTRRPFTVALSFSGQLLLAGLAILLPVLHTDAIKSNRMLHVVTSPRPLGNFVRDLNMESFLKGHHEFYAT